MNGHTTVFSDLRTREQNSKAHMHTLSSQGTTTFAFRKRWGQIDWRSLASVDVDKIAREMDFQSLQQNIMNVTFCNIESEEFHGVDQNFVKLFRLAQLIIEYLLHCQQYLSEQGSGFEQKAHEIQVEFENAKVELSTQKTELKALKKENKKRKKIIQAYQDMLNAGATGIHSCPVCKREFVSKEYLQSHIHRRHPDHSAVNDKEADKMWSKVSQEELEKRLMEQMTERFQATEAQLNEDLHKKEFESLQKHTKDFEKWKMKEQEKMKLELQEFKEPILTELRTIQQEKAHLEEVLLQKQAEIDALSAKKQSHLGHLEGAQELDIGGSLHRKAELDQLKQQLELKVHELQSSMRKQEKSWQKRLQRLSTSYQDQIKDSSEKFSILEQSLQESTLGKEKDKLQSSIHKQLSSMKKKIKEQEEQLHYQENQLAVLQSKEPTISSSSTPLRVSENPPTGVGSGPTSQVQVHEYQSETEDSVFESENDSDEVDSPQYHTPLPHRPMITTKFPHTPEVLENIKKETESILSDALQQRGLPKGVNGLSNDDFLTKMRSLEHERQQRIQTSHNFVEHRDRLVGEVENISQSDYVFEPPKSRPPQFPKKDIESKSLPGSAQQADLTVSLCSTSKSKPPKPAAAQLSSSQPVNSSGVSTVNPPQPDHPSIQVTPVVTPALRAEPSDSESSEGIIDKEEDEVSGLSSVTTSPLISRKDPPPSQSPQTTAHGAVTLAPDRQEDDSPWDSSSSEDDSIEALAAPQIGGRTSSTPIKSGNRKLKEKPQASVITIEPNPSKKPTGGVPLFQVLPMNGPQNEEDSFDISEPSFPTASTTGTNLKGMTKLQSSMRGGNSTQTVHPMSQTATSRSALTTVSVDDFVDSDFSDLDL